jgi:hypothetical protein
MEVNMVQGQKPASLAKRYVAEAQCLTLFMTLKTDALEFPRRSLPTLSDEIIHATASNC